jgi:predicted dehydrogenase
MGKRLRAVIMGAGFAGQGHTLALRDCGVEIVAMTGRTRAVVEKVARDMGIPIASVDWRATLAETHPDIVAVGTPGGTHFEMVGAALDLKCHVFLDKPQATTAAEAKQLYLQAGAAGVKTAYAASFRYQPAVLFAKELVASGAIGALYEVECVSHYNWPKLTSFGWPHRLATGGGRLNNNFVHKLAIVLNVAGGTVLAAMGETRNDLGRVPVGPPVHDFRQFTTMTLTAEKAARCEWRDVDSDWSYTVLARLGTPWRAWQRLAGRRQRDLSSFRFAGRKVGGLCRLLRRNRNNPHRWGIRPRAGFIGAQQKRLAGNLCSQTHHRESSRSCR